MTERDDIRARRRQVQLASGTSHMTELHWIEGPWPGRLATMARPRGGDWLDDELAGLHASGVGVLVSLLEAHEVLDLGLEREPEICARLGVTFLSVPVPDYGVPASHRAFTQVVNGLDEDLRAGTLVAIHCRMGIGRSSLLAAALLVRAGTAPSDTWPLISKARGLTVPDTEEQKEWLSSLSTRAG